MSMKSRGDQPVFYLPDSPNVGAAAPASETDGGAEGELDRARADDLAAKVATGDELSEYEKVAGRGVPRT